MSFSFKRPEDSPGFLLWQLTNQWQRLQRRALAKMGLTHPQFVALAGLLWLSSTTDEGITQKMVSDLTKIDKMTMSDLVVTLTKKKMLKRVAHPTDNRAYSLILTEKGRARVLAAIPVVEGVDAVFFKATTPGLADLKRVLF